jgi:hypothetical protein
MLDYLRARPWLFIVAFLAVAVLANLVFVYISVRNPPIPV